MVTRVLRQFSKERIGFSTNHVGVTDIHIEKNEVEPLPHSIYTNQLIFHTKEDLFKTNLVIL